MADAPMQMLDAAAVAQRLDFGALIDALARAFAGDVQAPTRLHGDLGAPADAPEQRDLLVMPAWQPAGPVGVKLVTLFEHNAQRGRPRIQGLYVLFDAVDGSPRAILDAAALTTRRTAAASALAARHLARADASRLLVLGSGRLARALPEAYAAIRPLQQVRIWARDSAAAATTATDIAAALPGVDVSVAPELADAARAADMISSAVPSLDPVLRGSWLSPGQHVDLIGSYRADMHEADTDCLTRSTLFVDTRAGVLAEAGEFIDALADGSIGEQDIVADLADLTTGRHPGRRTTNEITLFKSVGTALEDLTAACLAIGADGPGQAR